MNRITVSIISLAALSACMSASENEPSVTASDVDRAFAEAEAISRLPLTSTANLPTGSVTYRGQLGANVSGDANGSILGDMAMRVDFADNDIDGSVTNINLIDPNGEPNQRFDGSLNIDGVESSGRLDAFASGQITGVDNDGVEVDSQMLLTLDGDVHDGLRRGDAVFGSAEGTARGEFNMDVDGVFFGRAD
ncbi:hypothetical protein MWU60_14680 [Yoonia sp. F2084L]|uniref:hypothetical protein n=1 Tax=Yoonia sp. F2084L TaxID=2926419 RepID=UPI001FF3DC95|nr:hypothetical protein [Yoonia sp. F2084L]MCK0096822.1 hypothetical protein [Yoonia sp. F2084L]